MAKTEGLIIEDYDNRCDWVFPDSLERCWIIPCKTVKAPGGKLGGKFCSYHYEMGLQAILQGLSYTKNKKEA